VYTGFYWGNLSVRELLEDVDLDDRIILKWIFRKLKGGCMEWIEVSQERDR
jgi:hypothetical protein